MSGSVAQAASLQTRRTVSLPLALAGSVLLHLLVALLLQLLGGIDGGGATAAADSVDREVTFALAPTGPEEEGQIEEAPPTVDQGAMIEPDPGAPAPLQEVLLPPPPPPTPTPDLTLNESPIPPMDAPSEAAPLQEEAFDADEPQSLEPEREPELELEEVEIGAEELAARESLPLDPAGTFAPQRDARQAPSLSERLIAFDRQVERRMQELPPSVGPPRNVFEPDWSSLPATGQSVGQLVFESVDYDFSDYGRQIYWILWKTWHNRIYDRVDDFEKWSRLEGQWTLQHANGVSFSIAGDGDVHDIVLEYPSGCVPLDLSATEALDEALFPPLPPDFPRSQERVRITFHAQGGVNTMRRHLAYLKSRGVF